MVYPFGPISRKSQVRILPPQQKMIRVSEIANKAQVKTDEYGYIASYDGFLAEGKTRNEALNNLIDSINDVREALILIEISLFARRMRKSKYVRLLTDYKIGVN